MEAVKTGLFKTELLSKLVHGNIQQPERALTEAVKADPLKTVAKEDSQITISSDRSKPLLRVSRRLLPKNLLP